MNHQSDLVPDHTLDAGWIIRDVRHVGAPLLAPSWSIGPCRRTQEGELLHPFRHEAHEGERHGAVEREAG